MKNIKLLLFLQVVPIALFSQNFKFTYELRATPFIQNSSNIINEIGYLHINKNINSYFFSEKFLKIDSAYRILDEQNVSPYSALENFSKFKANYFFKEFIVKNYQDSKIEIFRELGIEHFKYQVKSVFQWEVKNEIDTLNNLICQKAVTTYSGREYVAWFTTEFPFSDGPYVFNGLPGLIVKIADTKNLFQFKLIHYEKEPASFILKPFKYSKALQISLKDFISLRIDLTNDPLKQFIDAGFTIKDSRIPDMSKTKMSDKINYIEIE